MTMKQRTHLKILLVLSIVSMLLVLASIANYVNPGVAFVWVVVIMLGWRGYLMVGYPPLSAIDLLNQGYFDSKQIALDLKTGDEIRALIIISRTSKKWVSFVRQPDMDDLEVSDWLDNFVDISEQMYVVRNDGC